MVTTPTIGDHNAHMFMICAKFKNKSAQIRVKERGKGWWVGEKIR
jgi:hypothetical protein